MKKILGWMSAGAVFLSAQAGAVEVKKTEAKKTTNTAPATAMPAAPMDPAMQKWMQLMEPSEGHQVFQDFVGKFTAKTKFWMQPGMPPQESTASSENTLILGGRFLKEEYTGSANGKPFSGIGYYGYNNVTKKYQATWMDSMNTALMSLEGNIDSSKKVITLQTTDIDPMTGKKKTIRNVIKIESKQTHTFEMYEIAADGAEFKSMEIIYTRVK